MSSTCTSFVERASIGELFGILVEEGEHQGTLIDYRHLATTGRATRQHARASRDNGKVIRSRIGVCSVRLRMECYSLRLVCFQLRDMMVFPTGLVVLLEAPAWSSSTNRWVARKLFPSGKTARKFMVVVIGSPRPVTRVRKVPG